MPIIVTYCARVIPGTDSNCCARHTARTGPERTVTAVEGILRVRRTRSGQWLQWKGYCVCAGLGLVLGAVRGILRVRRVPAVDYLLPGTVPVDCSCTMTLGEIVDCDSMDKKMPSVPEALEHLLVAAKRQDSLTVGVYESAKLMNVDPDSVVLCLLATDEEDEVDIALQIHFTLIQAFCCDNDINILRVSGMQRLEEILGGAEEKAEPQDLHCILVTNPHTDSWTSQGLAEVASFCEHSRGMNQWVPYISLQDR